MREHALAARTALCPRARARAARAPTAPLLPKHGGAADDDALAVDMASHELHAGHPVARREGAAEPLGEVFVRRASVLVALMLLQSASSSILAAYAELLSRHMVVTLFLTMLVGAGGNAGNQSAVFVIRGLATGSPAMRRPLDLLAREVLRPRGRWSLLQEGGRDRYIDR